MNIFSGSAKRELGSSSVLHIAVISENLWRGKTITEAFLEALLCEESVFKEQEELYHIIRR